MLFNLLLATMTIFSCFFRFFLVTFNNFFIIPVAKENTRVKFALANPAGIPITLVKERMLIPPDVTDKRLLNIIKSSNVFTKFFTHCLSFLDFRIKIVLHFFDFI